MGLGLFVGLGFGLFVGLGFGFGLGGDLGFGLPWVGLPCCLCADLGVG